MLEITLCRHNEMKGRYCADCAQETREMRACSDCEAYTRLNDMRTQADGRVVCPGCATKAKKKAVERAQLSFFGQQSLI